MSNWKKVQETLSGSINDCLHKMKVEGGYLYRSIIFTGGGTTQTLCFVPCVDLDESVEDDSQDVLAQKIRLIEARLAQSNDQFFHQELQSLRRYISECDQQRFESDAKLQGRIEQIERHFGYEYTECKNHEWAPEMLTTLPPKKRCIKCGYTTLLTNACSS